MSEIRKIKIGTRSSELALIQKDIICDMIKNDKLIFQTVIINTIGDQETKVPINQIGEQGVFTQELSRALCNKELDLIVHSLKDLPTKLDDNTVISMITERQYPNDVIVSRFDQVDLNTLSNTAIIGTSSPRRIAQLNYFYPYFKVRTIRGNINTRISKMKEGSFDCLILAEAGLKRLNLRGINYQKLDNFLYAVGQGALAVQSNEIDLDLTNIVAPFSHINTLLMCLTERSLLRTLGGGCCVPIGVRTNIKNNKLFVTAGVFTIDGSDKIVDYIEINLPSYSETNTPPYHIVDNVIVSENCVVAANKCVEGGEKLAKNLLKLGAQSILSNAKHICADRPEEYVTSYDTL